MAALNENAITLLASVQVDMNYQGRTVLYTVPPNKRCVSAFFVERDASSAVDGSAWSVGTNDPDYNDIVTYASLSITSTGAYSVIPVKDGAVIPLEGQQINLLVTVPQGNSAHVIIDLFGYLIQPD